MLWKVIKNVFSVMFSSPTNVVKTVAVLIINLVTNAIDLAAPFIFVSAVKEYGKNNPDEEHTALSIVLAGTYAATWSLGRKLPHLRNMLLHTMGAELATNLIKKVMRQFYSLSMEHRASNTNAPEVQHFGGAYEIGKAFITSFWGETFTALTGTLATATVVSIFYWDAGLIMIGVLPIYIFASILGSVFLDKAENNFTSNLFGGFEHIIAELDQYENAHYYGNVEYELDKTENMLSNLNNAHVRSLTTRDYVISTQIMVTALSFIAVSTYMGYEVVISKEHSIDDYIWTTLYSLIYSTYLSEFSRSYNSLYSNYSKYERILTYLDKESELNNDRRGNRLILEGRPNVISFQNISFSYQDDEKVLSNLTFEVPAGKTTVIVGLSGQGKSTILKLLLGFYEPINSDGQINVGGQNISNFSRKSLREQMAIVPQSPFLFKGTVFDNIKYGNFDATEEEVKKAAINAGIDGITLATQVGEKGAKLSGGQKQRISIARAYLRKKSPFLILDEPTSSLDAQTEEEVFQNLNHLIESERKTTLIITHKLSAVSYLEKNISDVIVLDRGRLAEKGKMGELLSKKGIFARQMSIIRRQVELSKEALDDLSDNEDKGKEKMQQGNIQL
jgi:ATP-binding cassette, subfamily B, heavy metal transporter